METGRGTAAAATWIFRGDGSRYRRGRHAAAAASPRHTKELVFVSPTSVARAGTTAKVVGDVPGNERYFTLLDAGDRVWLLSRDDEVPAKQFPRRAVIRRDGDADARGARADHDDADGAPTQTRGRGAAARRGCGSAATTRTRDRGNAGFAFRRPLGTAPPELLVESKSLAHNLAATWWKGKFVAFGGEDQNLTAAALRPGAPTSIKSKPWARGVAAFSEDRETFVHRQIPFDAPVVLGPSENLAPLVLALLRPSRGRHQQSRRHKNQQKWCLSEVATPRRRAGHSAETSRGDAAATTRIFRGDESTPAGPARLARGLPRRATVVRRRLRVRRQALGPGVPRTIAALREGESVGAGRRSRGADDVRARCEWALGALRGRRRPRLRRAEARERRVRSPRG